MLTRGGRKLVAFVSFLTFAIVQLVVALISKSEAMIGDCAAMAVDVMTYGFNLFAERKKHEDYETAHMLETLDINLPATSSGGETNTTTHKVGREKLDWHLRSKRRQLHLELVPPVISVSFLLIVTGFILRQSIHTLILDSHRNEKEQSRPNLVLMMTFSTLNLLLDVVNVVCFARAKHLMGYNTEQKEQIWLQNYNMIDNEGLIEDHVTHNELNDAVGGIVAEHNNDSSKTKFFNERLVSEEIDEDDHVNLNMCSAYTVSFYTCLLFSSLPISI
jgi:Co/Zn/Cd efflux system component